MDHIPALAIDTFGIPSDSKGMIVPRIVVQELMLELIQKVYNAGKHIGSTGESIDVLAPTACGMLMDMISWRPIGSQYMAASMDLVERLSGCT